jgi:hypothetical protein
MTIRSGDLGGEGLSPASAAVSPLARSTEVIPQGCFWVLATSEEESDSKTEAEGTGSIRAI